MMIFNIPISFYFYFFSTVAVISRIQRILKIQGRIITVIILKISCTNSNAHIIFILFFDSLIIGLGGLTLGYLNVDRG